MEMIIPLLATLRLAMQPNVALSREDLVPLIIWCIYTLKEPDIKPDSKSDQLKISQASILVQKY